MGSNAKRKFSEEKKTMGFDGDVVANIRSSSRSSAIVRDKPSVLSLVDTTEYWGYISVCNVDYTILRRFPEIIDDVT